MSDRKISNKKIAFIFALVYVALATIYCIWATKNQVSEGIFIFFLPAIIFPTLILLSESEPILMILLCQSITIILVWLLFWGIINLFRVETEIKEITNNE